MNTQDIKLYWYQSPGNGKGFFYKGTDTLCGFMANCLTGAWVCDKLHKIRQKPEQTKHLKKILPAYTISPVFDDPFRRKQEFVIGHTGLICLDIDDDHNPQITDWPALRDKLFDAWEEVVTAALSVSGKGIFLILAVNGVTVNTHKDYCCLLERALKRIDINVDPSCKDITRLRFLTLDPELRFRHKHRFLDDPPTLGSSHSKQKNQFFFSFSRMRDTNRIFQAAIKSAEKKYGPFADGNKHMFISSVTTFLKNAGVSPEDSISFVNNNLLDLREIKTNCINTK